MGGKFMLGALWLQDLEATAVPDGQPSRHLAQSPTMVPNTQRGRKYRLYGTPCSEHHAKLLCIGGSKINK